MAATIPPPSLPAARCIISDRSRFLADLRKIASVHNTRIICFNAGLIAGRAHAALAVTLALRAFENGENISNTLEMEALLFAAGTRQCNAAAVFGINPGENRLYVCCLPENDRCWTDLSTLFAFTEEDWDTIRPEKAGILMKTFSISPDEIAAAGGEERLVDLVLERVALLQVMR